MSTVEPTTYEQHECCIPNTPQSKGCPQCNQDLSAALNEVLRLKEVNQRLADMLRRVGRNIDISTINQSKRSISKWGELKDGIANALREADKE